jgi:hypothetical protein
MSYSIGSSSVEMLYLRGLKFFNIPNKVVDFHEPVGHATNIIQYVLFKISLTFSRLLSISHNASILVKFESCLSILITIFSQ